MPDELPPLVGHLTGDISDFAAKVDEAKRKAKEFADGRYAASITVNTGDASAKLAEVQAQLAGIGDSSARLGLDTGDVNERLDQVLAKLDAYEGTWVAVLEVETEGANRKLDETLSKMAEVQAAGALTGAGAGTVATSTAGEGEERSVEQQLTSIMSQLEQVAAVARQGIQVGVQTDEARASILDLASRLDELKAEHGLTSLDIVGNDAELRRTIAEATGLVRTVDDQGAVMTIGASIADLEEKVAEARALGERIGQMRETANFDANASEFVETVSLLQALVAEIQRNATIYVTANADEAMATLDRVAGKKEEIEKPVSTTLGADIADVEAGITKARALVMEFAALSPEERLQLDTTEWTARLEEAMTLVKSAPLDRIAKIAGNIDDLAAKTAEARTLLDTVEGKTVDVRVAAETEGAIAELEAYKAEVDTVIAKNDELKASGGGGGAGGGARGLFGLFSPFGGAAGLSPLFAGAIGLAPAIIAGLGPLTAGLGAAGIAGYGAFNNIFAAIQAQSQARQQAGQTHVQTVLQQLQANQQLVQSEQAVAQAAAAYANTQQQAQYTLMQATQAATNAQVTGNYQVLQSQEALNAAKQNAANSLRTATQALQQAEQQYTNSVWSEQQAQQALITARMQAKFQLQDYKNQLKDAALTQQQDYLAVQSALQQLQMTQANPAATRLQRQEAELAYQQALQQIQDQNTQYQQLQETASIAMRQGVKHAPSVVQAMEQVKLAVQAVKNAELSRSNAAISLAQTESNAVLSVKEAEDAVKMAIYQRAQADKQAAQALKEAHITTTQQLAQAKVAWQDAQKSASEAAKVVKLTDQQLQGAAATLQSAMNSLAPAAKSFVKIFESTNLSRFSKELQQIFFSTLLKGGTKSPLHDMMEVFQAIEPFIRAAAKGMADFLGDLAKWMSHGGLKGIVGLFRDGNAVFKAFGGVLSDLIKVIVGMGPEGTQVLLSLAKGLDTMVLQMGKWANSKPGHAYFTEMSQIFRNGGKALADFFQTLFDIIPKLLPLLNPALKLIDALLRVVDKFINAPGFTKGLHNFVKDIDNAVSGIAKMLSHLSGIATLIDHIAGAIHAVAGPVGWLAKQGIPGVPGDLGSWFGTSKTFFQIMGKLFGFFGAGVPDPKALFKQWQAEHHPHPQGPRGPQAGRDVPLGKIDLSAYIAPIHAKLASPPFAPEDHDQALSDFKTLGMAEGDSLTIGFISRQSAMNQAFLTLGGRAGTHFSSGLMAAIHTAGPNAWNQGRELGRAIDRGVEHGIKEGGVGIQTAIRQAIPEASFAHGGGTINFHVPITVNATSGQTARDIAEMVKSEFIKMDKRNGGHLQPGARSPRTRGT